MTEIEKLRKELNDRLDSFDNKPKYEVGKWYKGTIIENSYLFVVSIANNKGYGYGLLLSIWKQDLINCEADKWRLATDDEVLEALTKEAIKRGLVEGANFKTPQGTKYKSKGKLCIWHNEPTYGLNYDESYGLILDNGIWATVIKERSLEEWYKGWAFEVADTYLIDYIKSTKIELIEILKNLPNDK